MASEEQAPVVGWLTSHPRSGQAWPGVLLHRDAFVIRAPRKALVTSSGDLEVVVESADELEPALRVVEVKLLEVDGSTEDPVTAMLQLESDAAIEVSRAINRSGFEIAVRVTGDVWKALASLGVVPEHMIGRLPPSAVLEGPPPVPVRTVPVEAAGWCDIFWWLC